MSQLIDNLNLIVSIKADIKSAIENKGVDMTGVSFPGYASKIGEISGGGGVKPSGTLDISDNGVYDVYSYASASVDVHPSASLSETYTSNGNYNITGEFNGGVIKVDVPAPQFVTETLNVSANGTYTPGQGVDGYSQVVVDVPISGWDQKSITEEVIKIINLDNSASFVASDAFYRNSTIQTVNLPYATIVNDYAFYGCKSLSQVSLPMCSYIGKSVFDYCSSLSQVNLPMCKYINDNVFDECSSLSQISLPMCSYIGNGAFGYCYSLSQVNLPICETVNTVVFTNCSHLTSIDLPMCKVVGQQAFDECSSLSQVNLPMCSYIGSYAFRNCYSLSQISLPVCNYIADYAFWFCSSFNIITLGYSSVCSLINSNAFSKTQITSSTGSIYVPTSLVDAYKSATNWSYFSTQIFPISE